MRSHSSLFFSNDFLLAEDPDLLMARELFRGTERLFQQIFQVLCIMTNENLVGSELNEIIELLNAEKEHFSIWLRHVSFKALLWMERFTQYTLLMRKQEYAYECSIDIV